jgi:hypothetical protein
MRAKVFTGEALARLGVFPCAFFGEAEIIIAFRAPTELR